MHLLQRLKLCKGHLGRRIRGKENDIAQTSPVFSAD
jgi:hypothetical protein